VYLVNKKRLTDVILSLLHEPRQHEHVRCCRMTKETFDRLATALPHGKMSAVLFK
jgi:hypothetical protein